MEPTVFWVRSRGQGRAHYKSVRTRLDPHGCLVHDSTTCALYNKNESPGAETAVGSKPMASQCTKGNHVVTGEVFFLDIGLLMGVNANSITSVR
jgi:hypothetical protein